MNKSIGLAAIFIFTCLLTLATPTTGASWGESCAGDAGVCDTTSFLECDPTEEVCRCQNRDNSYFDQGDRKCHIFYDGQCQDIAQGVQPCPLNGFCDVFEEPFKCRCIGGFTQTSQNKCTKQYQEPCSAALDCDRDSFMGCLEGGVGEGKICQCDPKSSYQPANGQCALNLHEPCTESSVQNPAPQSCFEGTVCTDKEEAGTFSCQCREGTTDNGQVCQVGFGQDCGGLIQCDDSKFLTCGQNPERCQCLNPDMAWYDQRADTCALRESADCLKSPPEVQKCASNSFCQNKTEEGGPQGFCKCEGYTHPNRQHLCFLEAGQYCTPLDPLDQCDYTQYLHCNPITVTCTCEESPDIIAEAASRCRIKFDSPCLSDEMDPNYQPCTTNGHCEEGKCACDAALSSNSVGKCVLPYDDPCGGLLPGGCNAEGFQHCGGVDPNKKCGCMDTVNMVYDGSTNVCAIKVAGTCQSGGLIPCTAHATCDDAGTCHCEDGWENNGGLCVESPPRIFFNKFSRHQKY